VRPRIAPADHALRRDRRPDAGHTLSHGADALDAWRRTASLIKEVGLILLVQLTNRRQVVRVLSPQYQWKRKLKLDWALAEG